MTPAEVAALSKPGVTVTTATDTDRTPEETWRRYAQVATRDLVRQALIEEAESATGSIINIAVQCRYRWWP